MATGIKLIVWITGLYYVGTTYAAIQAGQKTPQDVAAEIMGMAQWLIDMARPIIEAIFNSAQAGG